MNGHCDDHDELIKEVTEIKTHVRYLRDAREREERAQGNWLSFAGKVMGELLQGALGGVFAMLLWWLQSKP